MNSQNYSKAAEYFSTILSLDPVNRMEVLIKRNKARASMNAWKDALSDADEVYFERQCFKQDQ
jgi:anti-sigma-K factor RskA